MTTRLAALLLLCLATLVPSASAMRAAAPADPFDTLRAAYAARDADAAAAAYTDDAVVEYRYTGDVPERHAGRAAIAASFAAFFDGLEAGRPVTLEFRFDERDATAARGVYRLRIGDTPFFGRFDVTFAADGRFATDVSSDATEEDFERVAAPVPDAS